MTPERINQRARAAEAWSIISEQAKKKQAITYGQLADKMNVHPRVCRFFLGLIQDYCMNAGLPPLQSLVVYKQTGIPGEGYHASSRSQISETHESVFALDWDNRRNPFR